MGATASFTGRRRFGLSVCLVATANRCARNLSRRWLERCPVTPPKHATNKELIPQVLCALYTVVHKRPRESTVDQQKLKHACTVTARPRERQGTIGYRMEPDHLSFWTTADLENKLLEFRTYFNNHRTHSSREGRTPVTPVSRPIANLRSFRWQPHCRSLYHTPMAA